MRPSVLATASTLQIDVFFDLTRSLAVRVPGVWRESVVRRADRLSAGGRTSDPTFATYSADILREPRRSSGPRSLRRAVHDWTRFSKKWCLQTPTSRWRTPGDRTTLRHAMPTRLVPHPAKRFGDRRRDGGPARAEGATQPIGTLCPLYGRSYWVVHLIYYPRIVFFSPR